MDTIINILSLIGALAMFLYGMKTMSEGLEKVAGESMRSILAAMTRNRVMGMLTGILITALLQSSSATTVMVVSFVNAKMMTLVQSIGVIMGANIGTTVTSWIVSAVGFKVNIAAFAIPLLAFALPLWLGKNSKRKNVGSFIFGFTFLFLSLQFLQIAADSLNLGNAVANLMTHVPCGSFWTIILLVFIGAIVTMVVQASAATMTITLLLVDMGIPGFGFEEACALAMGQNIGTTVTAFLASLTTGTEARRAAMAHMFFNVFGVIVILIVFYPVCNSIKWILSDLLHTAHDPKFEVSMFHTAFNMINTMLLIWFVPQIEKFVCWIIPQKDVEEEYRLKYISKGLVATPELSLLEAKKEIGVFAERCAKMYEMVKQMLVTKDKKEFDALYERVNKYEKITDNMEVEIAEYLSDVEDDAVSKEAKTSIQKMMKAISELESVGDSCSNLGRTLSLKRETGNEYTTEQMGHINAMLGYTNKAMKLMCDNLNLDGGKVDFDATMNNERDINDLRKLLKDTNIKDISNDKYSYQLGVQYMDFINECEHLGDYVVNVVQACK